MHTCVCTCACVCVYWWLKWSKRPQAVIHLFVLEFLRLNILIGRQDRVLLKTYGPAFKPHLCPLWAVRSWVVLYLFWGSVSSTATLEYCNNRGVWVWTKMITDRQKDWAQSLAYINDNCYFCPSSTWVLRDPGVSEFHPPEQVRPGRGRGGFAKSKMPKQPMNVFLKWRDAAMAQWRAKILEVGKRTHNESKIWAKTY